MVHLRRTSIRDSIAQLMDQKFCEGINYLTPCSSNSVFISEVIVSSSSFKIPWENENDEGSVQ